MPEPTRILKYSEDQNCFQKISCDKIETLVEEKSNPKNFTFPYKLLKSIDVSGVNLCQQNSIICVTDQGNFLIGHEKKVAKLWFSDISKEVNYSFFSLNLESEVTQIKLISEQENKLNYVITVNDSAKTLFVCLDGVKLR
jgi:hypothetical protein